MFQVGQRVVCIESRGWINHRGEHCPYATPIVNNIYTICHIGHRDHLAFHELPRGHWHPLAFRPIVERKTDISTFLEMLNKVPELVE